MNWLALTHFSILSTFFQRLFPALIGYIYSFLTLHYFKGNLLTPKVPNKNCSRLHFNFLFLSFEENKA